MQNIIVIFLLLRVRYMYVGIALNRVEFLLSFSVSGALNFF